MALALCCYCDYVLDVQDFVITPEKSNRLIVASAEVLSLLENQFGRDLIGDQFHSLYTLALQVARCGPIWGFSCASFERLFRYLKLRMHSPSAPEANEAHFYQVFLFVLFCGEGDTNDMTL